MYCQKCGTQNPEGTNNCSNCGAPLNATPAKPKKKKTGLIIAIVAIIAVIAIIAALGGGGDKKPDTSSNSNASTSAASASVDKAKSDFEVKLKSSKITKDYEGKPALIVKYTFTNNSDKTASWAYAIQDNAFQNGIGLNTAIITGSNDIDTQTKQIMPGKSLDVQVAYSLDDTATPVEIQISELISLDDTPFETFTVNLK